MSPSDSEKRAVRPGMHYEEQVADNFCRFAPSLLAFSTLDRSRLCKYGANYSEDRVAFLRSLCRAPLVERLGFIH